jgi:hypothetical protein
MHDRITSGSDRSSCIYILCIFIYPLGSHYLFIVRHLNVQEDGIRKQLGESKGMGNIKQGRI